MGGVDRLDQNVSVYRVKLRSKKWWWPLFSYALDVSLQNVWILYRQSATRVPMDQLQFRRAVVQLYLKQYAALRPSRALGPASGPCKSLQSDLSHHQLPDDATGRETSYQRCSHIHIPYPTITVLFRATLLLHLVCAYSKCLSFLFRYTQILCILYTLTASV